jgi:hypothetical protein
MSYDKITILQWEQVQEYMKIPDAFASQQEVYKILTGQSQEDINGLKVQEFFNRYNEVTEFLLHDMPQVIIEPFILQGVTYHPYLQYYDWPVWRMASITAAAGMANQNLPLLIALCTYKDKGEKLTVSEVKDREDLFRNNLNVAMAFSYVAFFLDCYKASLRIIANYYPEVAERMNLQPNGDGTFQSIEQQEGEGIS